MCNCCCLLTYIRSRVVTPPLSMQNCPGNPNSHLGRIVYEKNSECFFVQFSPEDVEDGRPVRQGDEVSFLPARDSL